MSEIMVHSSGSIGALRSIAILLACLTSVQLHNKGTDIRIRRENKSGNGHKHVILMFRIRRLTFFSLFVLLYYIAFHSDGIYQWAFESILVWFCSLTWEIWIATHSVLVLKSARNMVRHVISAKAQKQLCWPNLASCNVSCEFDRKEMDHERNMMRKSSILSILNGTNYEGGHFNQKKF